MSTASIPHYTLLGAGDTTLSLILESLARRHPSGVRATIATNVAFDETVPWATPGVETEMLDHALWAAQLNGAIPANCISGVYKPATKQAVFAFFRDHYGVQEAHYTVLQHPGVDRALTVEVDPGTFIGPQVAIAPYTRLGKLVSINRGCTVGHHTVLGAYCTLNPGVQVAGKCRVGRAVTIGMGAKVVDGVRIGDGSVIGAGALVTKDVPSGVLAYGVPARIKAELD
ncbi:MAG: hypothetical protein AAGH19_06900 [Pseudomonadota bacterium]